LNWVALTQAGETLGYVQATVQKHECLIAYEFHSDHWRKGFAFESVSRMLIELVEHYAVTRVAAVLKASNQRSARLLTRLGLLPLVANNIEPDEIKMVLETQA
jgi:RimJ/RimL family protein N-acetyltransferase